MRRRTLAATLILVVVIVVSLFAALLWSNTSSGNPEFYVGVEVAYQNANASDVKVMVDKVKNCTNLVVIGSPEISLNQTALNETCDYINDAGLHFIVLFTELPRYTTYDPFLWMIEAKRKYGEKLLGVYRFDEPGGHQVDQGSEAIVTNATSYADAAKQYIESLGIIVGYYLNYSGQVFTADYALHWFDYESKYSAVFSEFTSNNTREIAVAQCRGAASSFGRDWGAMLTWKYDAPPYIESGEELYADMVSAYKAGAKYVIVFNYPKLDTYGILKNEHFDALKEFWDYTHDNPQDFGSQKAKVAYVLPEDYGFGLRRPDDSIWGLFPPDELSAQAWNDVNRLVELYGFGLDIIYDEPGVVDAARGRYERLVFWNETIS
jgi:hypothetical protein